MEQDIARIMRKADINESLILMNELKDLLGYALTQDNETMANYYMTKIADLRSALDNIDTVDA